MALNARRDPDPDRGKRSRRWQRNRSSVGELLLPELALTLGGGELPRIGDQATELPEAEAEAAIPF